MSGHPWADKYAIMKDLSLVQGCVPADLERPVGATDKPPVRDIVEENEEEFFKNCVGDGDFTAPDLGLIKQMLDMVRESERSSDLEDCDANEAVQITKLYPLSAEFVPSMTTPPLPPTEDVKLAINGTSNVVVNAEQKENGYAHDMVPVGNKKHKSAVKKTKNHRNVAMTSLLQTIAEKNFSKIEAEKEKKLTNGLAVNLLKPTDFVLSDNVTKSTDKVNDCFKKTEETDKVNDVAIAQDKLNILMNPSRIFKRKTGNTNDLVKVETQNQNDLKSSPKNYVPPSLVAPQDKLNILMNPSSMFKKKVPISNGAVKVQIPDQKQVQSPPNRAPPKDYVPSSLAKEYYKQFEQRSKMKQIVQEDIWEKAERQMKEMDEQRKQEAEHASQLSLSSDATSSSESTERKLEEFQLPVHRHQLAEECVVCQVMCQKEPDPELPGDEVPSA